MMEQIKLGSLFDGSGGFPLGGMRGIRGPQRVTIGRSSMSKQTFKRRWQHANDHKRAA